MHNKDEAFAVVNEFCDVCAGMGFFDFRRLPLGLLEEYPAMFEEVKDPKNKISKEFVAKYLKDFFAFYRYLQSSFRNANGDVAIIPCLFVSMVCHDVLLAKQFKKYCIVSMECNSKECNGV